LPFFLRLPFFLPLLFYSLFPIRYSLSSNHRPQLTPNCSLTKSRLSGAYRVFDWQIRFLFAANSYQTRSTTRQALTLAARTEV
jgi:hypothetical protein